MSLEPHAQASTGATRHYPKDATVKARIVAVARVAHEVNRAYCESIGDTTQPAWEHAPMWQLDSACAGVAAHLASELTPEQSHEAWRALKQAEGWKWGPVKDAEKKEHPCMAFYLDLPPEQRTKDFLFRAVVHALRFTKMGDV